MVTSFYLLLTFDAFLSVDENIPLSIPPRSIRPGMNWCRTINTPKTMNNAAISPRLSTSVPPEAKAFDTVTNRDNMIVDMVFMTFSF
jgi:hypothetical protein